MYTSILEVTNQYKDWRIVWEDVLTEQRPYYNRPHVLAIHVFYSKDAHIGLCQASPVLAGYTVNEYYQPPWMWNPPVFEITRACNHYTEAIRWGQTLNSEALAAWDNQLNRAFDNKQIPVFGVTK